MSDINTVTIEGRLGRDPQITNTDKGKIARFSIATAEHYKSGDDVKERVTWNQVSVLDKYKAEYVEKNLHKGSHVLIQGAIETRSYESEGSTRYSTEVVLRPGKALLKSLDVTPKTATISPADGLAETIGPREQQQNLRQHNQ